MTDRWDEEARKVLRAFEEEWADDGAPRLSERIATAIRAAHAEGIERAAQTADSLSHDGRRVAATIRSLLSPTPASTEENGK